MTEATTSPDPDEDDPGQGDDDRVDFGDDDYEWTP